MCRFMITGIVAGPYVLDVVEKRHIKSLSYINMFALAFITTSVHEIGAEFLSVAFSLMLVTDCTCMHTYNVYIYSIHLYM